MLPYELAKFEELDLLAQIDQVQRYVDLWRDAARAVAVGYDLRECDLGLRFGVPPLDIRERQVRAARVTQMFRDLELMFGHTERAWRETALGLYEEAVA